jgi:putative Mg2+ transporter-C (MgtC) family protein
MTDFLADFPAGLLGEFTRPTWLSFPAIAARLLLAAVLGGAIGFEREWRNRPAGLRTHILICVAAAMIGILTIEIAHAPAFAREGATADPIRAVEAVTAGVAFLAAGTILFARGEVQGLTTGAGMWLAGAVGLSCGLGLWQIAAFGTLLALVVLWALASLVPPQIGDRRKAAPPAEATTSAAGPAVDKPPLP